MAVFPLHANAAITIKGRYTFESCHGVLHLVSGDIWQDRHMWLEYNHHVRPFSGDYSAPLCKTDCVHKSFDWLSSAKTDTVQ